MLAAVSLLLAHADPAAALLPDAAPSGAVLYQRECGGCHGPAGHGDGGEAPTFVVAPRDLQADLLAKYTPDDAAARIRRSRLRILEIDLEVVETRRKRMVEELATYLQKLPDVDWPRARRGADIYARSCESCHGPLARPVTPTALQRSDPRPTSAPPRPDFQKALGDAELLASARGKHPEVKGFAPLARDDDARALLVYLRLLTPGFARYAQWCAGCHGDEGRGDGPFATGIDKPKRPIDRAYLDALGPGVLRRASMHLMTEDEALLPHYQRELTVEQAHMIVTALGEMSGAGPPVAAPLAPSPTLRPPLEKRR